MIYKFTAITDEEYAPGSTRQHSVVGHFQQKQTEQQFRVVDKDGKPNSFLVDGRHDTHVTYQRNQIVTFDMNNRKDGISLGKAIQIEPIQYQVADVLLLDGSTKQFNIQRKFPNTNLYTILSDQLKPTHPAFTVTRTLKNGTPYTEEYLFDSIQIDGTYVIANNNIRQGFALRLGDLLNISDYQPIN